MADEPELSIERPKTSTRDRAALHTGLETWLRQRHPAAAGATIAEFARFRRRLVERLGFDVGHHDPRALAQHAFGQFEADATRGTGHDCSCSSEIIDHRPRHRRNVYIAAVADEPELSIERPKTSTRDRAALRTGLETWLQQKHPAGTGASIAEFDAPSTNGMSSETILVTVHSFTPTYKGMPRPWPIGLIHATDPSFTSALRDALLEDSPDLNVGWNEPYSAMNGVTYTLEHHGDGRGLDATMIEIRHNEILEPAGVTLWATRLASCLERARGHTPAADDEGKLLGSTRRHP